MSGDSYAGYQRPLETRLRVRVAERVSSVLIGLGGAGTVVAVFGVCFFLVSVVVPLFLPGRTSDEAQGAVPWERLDDPVLEFGIDEYRWLGWAFFRSGTLDTFRLDTGELLHSRQLVDGGELSAWSFSLSGDSAAFGFRDGGVQLLRLDFEIEFLDADDEPSELESLEPGERAIYLDGVVSRAEDGALRLGRLRVTKEARIEPDDASSSVRAIDHVRVGDGSVLATIDSNGITRLTKVSVFENFMTGELVAESESSTLPSPDSENESHPDRVLVNRTATTTVVLWDDGRAVRYDTRNFDEPVVAETIRLTDPGDEITAFDTLIGKTTLLVGTRDGRVNAWFPSKVEGLDTPDAQHLVRAHDLTPEESPISAFGPSPRSRVAAVAHESGVIRIMQVNSDDEIVRVGTGGVPVRHVRIAPKNDAVVALTDEGIWRWDLDVGHPAASMASLFLPVWYEGYPVSQHVWQSSGGDDADEPKFGLWPLVFGTIKATFYSVLFGVPIAILAAVFTSEFLTTKVRTRVKSIIELIASLPSVVLGFLAALVFAPIVQRVLPTVLLSILAVPGSFLVGAYVWQLLPNDAYQRLRSFRIWAIALFLPIGAVIAILLGPAMEDVFFGGDIMLWLDGQHGSGFAGWLFLLSPLAITVVFLAFSFVVGPWFRQRAGGWTHGQLAMFDGLRFAAGVVLTIVVASLLALAVQYSGFDPRGEGSVIGTYVQRNALIVGFIMGFAVIPIIYTIAEDALSAVPDNLRAASLGAGATPWQTAVRIVVPTAMSGLFSAVMVGLGRAVGETMIVLMAAGNTAVLDMNIFSGFRTLSANIAVEMPEAVKDSTHYRTLFLAALILFALTFVINTVAELVRMRFRRRAYQL